VAAAAMALSRLCAGQTLAAGDVVKTGSKAAARISAACGAKTALSSIFALNGVAAGAGDRAASKAAVPLATQRGAA